MIRPESNQDMAGTQAAMLRATRKALHEAKLRGEPVPQWRDGKVVWVQPDKVQLPTAQDEQPDRRES
ncbi:MAG: hypothetical protein WD534_16635 [Phycisphaeraceae bacterium]